MVTISFSDWLTKFSFSRSKNSMISAHMARFIRSSWERESLVIPCEVGSSQRPSIINNIVVCSMRSVHLSAESSSRALIWKQKKKDNLTPRRLTQIESEMNVHIYIWSAGYIQRSEVILGLNWTIWAIVSHSHLKKQNFKISFIKSFRGNTWAHQIDLLPSVWRHSSVGRVLHRYRRAGSWFRIPLDPPAFFRWLLETIAQIVQLSARMTSFLYRSSFAQTRVIVNVMEAAWSSG